MANPNGTKENLRPWKKGQSGNPLGKQMAPTRADAIAIFKSHSPALMLKACEVALAGDPTLLKAAMAKILPDKMEVSTNLYDGLREVYARLDAKYGCNPQKVDAEVAPGSLEGGDGEP